MTTIKYLPSIKVIDLLQITHPLKITVTTKDNDINGPLWWKFAPCIPHLNTDPKVAVSILPDYIGDRYLAYIFSQTFYTIFMYNNLVLDNPLRYYVDNQDGSFYYFIAKDEILIIPLLYRSPFLSVMFTKYNDNPALKISVKSNTQT